MKKKNDNGERILTTSRKARYDYSIIEAIVVDHDKAEFCGRYCTNLLDPKERKCEDCRFFDCVGKNAIQSCLTEIKCTGNDGAFAEQWR